MTLTAAERARRYRARRRDAVVTVRDVPVRERDALDDRLGRIEALLEELVAALVHNVDERDANGRHAVQRDVTGRHATEGAPAPARVGARLTPPSGASEPLAVERDGVTTEPRILELLAAVHEPASAGAIADALRRPTSEVVDELVALQRIGRVQRVEATRIGERDRWRLLGAAPTVEATIRCAAYREHATTGHRRDPESGRFRCYICEPESAPLEAAYMGGST